MSDSMEAIQAITKGMAKSSVAQEWVDQCFRLLDKHKGWDIEFTRREDNTIADRMTKIARDKRWPWMRVFEFQPYSPASFE
ncbi:hypothetical protein QQ045_016885 [Rhodiola kirilowii]